MDHIGFNTSVPGAWMIDFDNFLRAAGEVREDFNSRSKLLGLSVKQS